VEGRTGGPRPGLGDAVSLRREPPLVPVTGLRDQLVELHRQQWLKSSAKGQVIDV
jgi:hypothetical protein